MSCRWASWINSPPIRPNSDPSEGGGLASVYADLVRARREADFRWLARSQGMRPEAIDTLWRDLSARLAPLDERPTLTTSR
jgi:hypothetical protein